MTTRRQFTTAAGAAAASSVARPVIGGATVGLSSVMGLAGCAAGNAADSYEALAVSIRQAPAEPPRQPGQQPAVAPLAGTALQRELVRCATLAPSSHNTQCWTFALEGARGAGDTAAAAPTLGNGRITLRADESRRCPAVDPDDHHMFVSLGCAAENLAHAALAHGLHADVRFDAAREVLLVGLAPTPARSTPLYEAIAARQCTRGDYDGRLLTSSDLTLLEQAGTAPGVRVLLLTERQDLERVLEHVVAGNTAQLADPAFVKELKTWIRFNGSAAARHRDGLFSVCSGNPAIPTWVGELAFGAFFTAKGENDKIARQIRSSAGLAVFISAVADKAHWVAVGRAYERFALQATALGIRNAFLNQPVEVAAVRSQFAAAVGMAGQRPDLLVRFGRGPTMPASLRRPVQAVLV